MPKRLIEVPGGNHWLSLPGSGYGYEIAAFMSSGG
jgi:hypothetical protein